MCGVCSGYVADYCGTERSFGGGELTGLEIHAGQTASGATNKAFGGADAMADAIARADAKWGDVGFGTTGGTVTFSFSDYRGAGAMQFTAEGRALVVDALRMITDVADIDFAWADDGDFDTTDSQSGNIVYTQYGTSSLGGGEGGWSGERWYGDSTWTITDGEVDVDGQNLSLFIHETMHALGLSHPGNYNGGGATYANDAAFWDDTAQFTVMSYFSADKTGGNYARNANTNLMLYDIAVLQLVYGANTTTRTGETVYGFNSTARIENGPDEEGATGALGDVDASWRLDNASDDIIGAIWDAGGRDTIDLSGFSSASDVDLREGGFSSFGGLTNNLAVAFGAVIEDAIGGAGDDTLRGNAAANKLTGNAGDDTLRGDAGNDVLVGGAGADALDGGTGTDVASYATSAAGLTVDLTNGAANTGDAAGDTFTSVENLVGSARGDTLRGDGVANTLSGRGGNDVLFGRDGADRLFGDNGNDILFGGAGGDLLNGGRGFDYASYKDSASGIVIDVISPENNAGDAAGDVLRLIENLVGSNLADTILGGNVQNELLGRNGADVIDGRGGADMIDGGGGADVMTGGQGYDTFRYQLAGESTAAATDTITDFDRRYDLIDLSRVDADATATGNQAFAFVGQAAFSGEAGELRYAVANGDARVEADVDGDGTADLVIGLDGVTQLSANDFVL